MIKEILTYGLLLGLITMGITYLAYQGTIGSFLSSGAIIGAMIIIFIVGILALKKKGGGFISFSEILLFCISVTFIGILLSILLNTLYLQMISLEEKDAIISNSVESQISAITSMGIPATDDMEEEMTKVVEYSMTIKGGLMGLLSSLFYAGVFGMILGLIFKKDNSA